MKAHIGPIIKRIWILPFKNCLFVLTYTTINTTAYRLGLYKPTSPPTKELHGFGQPTIGRGMTVVGKGRKIFILKQRGHDIDSSHPRRDPIIMAIRRTNEIGQRASIWKKVSHQKKYFTECNLSRDVSRREQEHSEPKWYRNDSIVEGAKHQIFSLRTKAKYPRNYLSCSFFVLAVLVYLKMGYSRPLFIYFRLFNTVNSEYAHYKILDSNLGNLI